MNGLAVKMRKSIPHKIMVLLRFIGDLAQEKGYSAFVVGGFVRDLMIGVRNLDIDIVLEGDAIVFSREFAGRTGGTLVTHKKFGTATVVMPWGIGPSGRFKVDFATARQERYERPAALPDVEASSLADDLYRRDFTINAMAISLTRDSFGRLIDFFEGEKHISEGVISVLHEASFIDDPTRIFRAVRFAQRYGFRIDGRTERLINAAIKKDMLGRTKHQRIRNELVLMLKEGDPAAAIIRMHKLDELAFIHPKMGLGKGYKKLFKSIADGCRWYRGSSLKGEALDIWLIYLMALFDGLGFKETKEICEKFAFRRKDRIRILSYKKEGNRLLSFFSKDKGHAPCAVYKMLRGLSREAVLLVMAKTKTKAGKKAIRAFLTGYDKVMVGIDGKDLERLGFKPGPGLGRALDDILYAKIDGRLRTKREELAYARRLLKANCRGRFQTCPKT